MLVQESVNVAADQGLIPQIGVAGKRTENLQFSVNVFGLGVIDFSSYLC